MINIVTVKWGTLYGPEYVNRIFNMVQRNTQRPFRLFCLTDNSEGIDSAISCIPLPNLPLQGWWWKPYMFAKGLFPSGLRFYLDLDMIIISGLDDYFTYKPGKFVGLQNLYHLRDPQHQNLGSAILRWPDDRLDWLWTRLANKPELSKDYPGDQDYIWHWTKSQLKFFPKEWTASYKWSQPVVGPQTKIVAFHGHPNPHDVPYDALIQQHWK